MAARFWLVVSFVSLVRRADSLRGGGAQIPSRCSHTLGEVSGEALFLAQVDTSVLRSWQKALTSPQELPGPPLYRDAPSPPA